jgi:hypothetical protein
LAAPIMSHVESSSAVRRRIARVYRDCGVEAPAVIGRCFGMGRRLLGVGVAVASLVACGRERKPETSAPPIDAGEQLDVEDAPVAVAPPSPPPPPSCEDNPGVFLFVGPNAPWTGAPLRVLAVTDKPLVGELALAHDGVTTTSATDRNDGPPYFWSAGLPAPAAGAWTATFKQDGCEPSRGETSIALEVGTRAPFAPWVPPHGVWVTKTSWNHAYENVYSAWVQMLFDAADKDEPSWTALHELIRDPKRNWLFDHLGNAEDSGWRAPTMHPDCADLPYFLRAYFAFKLGLPFGIAECDRGGDGAPPSCKNLVTNEDDDEHASDKRKDGVVAMFGAFLAVKVADLAHSGSARAPFAEQDADYYPVPIDWANLRPGTVYADPYGHTLLVAKKLPQDAEHGGVLFAVDGQPDGTVARKRFWRGNFLYAIDPALGGPGFKRFRPVVRAGGVLTRMSDEKIKSSAEYGDLSHEAAKLDVEAFYDRMEDVLSPKPLDADRALMETIAALEEQVRTRVKSIENGRKWLAKHEKLATMPEGAEIFETSGPWEDYSTPSRDLRLLIAIDVVRGFPARAVRRKERYATLPIESDLQKMLDRELAARSIVYTRSDGSPFTVTLGEVLARSDALELAYDPNDSVEIRWGAPGGSEELSTCNAHAPSDQRARMETYRPWFHERKRPPRK